MKCMKVIHVLGSTNLGGAESRIMDLYRNVNREEVQFDFLVHMNEKAYRKAIQSVAEPETLREEGYFDKEIKSLGGHVYAVPRFKIYNLLSYRKAIKQFFEKHQGEYQVVHGHMTSTASIYLPVAKKAGCPVTIAHARSAGVDHGIKGTITKLLRKNLWRKADYLFTCSKLAAQAVFGHEAIFFPNAIETDRFCYNSQMRSEIRKELGIDENTVVIGHVGRFHYAKNHEFLLNVFNEYRKINDNCKLLMLGDGPGFESQKELAKQLGIWDKAIFAGNKSDTEKYYSAMDVFVFPSRFEGLPGTVIEAQASGIPCMISDAIAEETKVTDLILWKSIDEEPKEWAKCISELINPNADRKAYAETVKNAGFDVKTQAKHIAELYREYIEKAESEKK